MFKFFFSFELKKLFGIIGVIFVGIICFVKGVSGSLSGKKKRSLWGLFYLYSIFVDDFIEKIIILVLIE